jgi:hypothetical protein
LYEPFDHRPQSTDDGDDEDVEPASKDDALARARSWSCFSPVGDDSDDLALPPLYTVRPPKEPMSMSGLPPYGARFVSKETHRFYVLQDLAYTRALSKWSAQTDDVDGPDDECRAVYDKFSAGGISDFHMRRTPANYAEFIVSGKARDFFALDDGAVYNGPGNYAYGTFYGNPRDQSLDQVLAGIYGGEGERGFLTAWCGPGQRGLMMRDKQHHTANIPMKVYADVNGIRQKPHKMAVTMYGELFRRRLDHRSSDPER